MKTPFFLLLTAACWGFAGCSSSRTLRTDAVEVADSANDSRTGQTGYDKAGYAFLVDAADARMMDIKEGHIAAKKGTSPDIRAYGRLMIKEQTAILTSIRKLASIQNVSLPADISNSKKEGFAQLAELSGDDLDDKFVKMMIIDHERDVKEFQEAQTSPNTSIAAFARTTLPRIQSHLDKIETIRDKRKK